MGVGVGTILRRYVTHALMNPSDVYLADFPDLRFRPIQRGQGISRPDAGSFLFVETGPMQVDGFGATGTGRPVYSLATGAVGVIVPASNHERSRDLAHRYAEATRRALHTGPWPSFNSDGATLGLSHFDFYVNGRLQPTTIQLVAQPDAEPYYIAITQYRGTAQPAA